MTDTSAKWAGYWFCICLLVLLTLVFLKNAWVCDDAYIIFRSIEQLFAGNGPNWNPHERVQAFTSPLWFWILAAVRVLSADHFFNVILVSLLLFLFLGLVLQRYFKTGASFAVILAVAAGSNAFFDFTTSGLENILCYLVVAIGLLSGFASFKASTGTDAAICHYRRALIAFALAPLCRHDLLTLLLIPLLALISLYPRKTLLARFFDCILVVTPLALWSVFSLVYYGALFPNTAYAKILTGISRYELLYQGIFYVWVTLYRDPVTVLIILAGFVAAAFSDNRFAKAIGIGLATNMLYVVWVGGDFMRGRFLSVSFLAALLLFVESGLPARFALVKPSLSRALAVVFAAFLLLFPSTPINTGLTYQDFSLTHGIADERGYYFDVCSLYAYLYCKPGEVFPDFEWSHIGRQIAASGVGYLENDFNGMLGYWAGTHPIIIDRLALTDPFLARQQVQDTKAWRIGHFKRLVPEDYRRSFAGSANTFKDPRQAALYDMLLLATREKDFFSAQRMRAVVKLNLGMY